MSIRLTNLIRRRGRPSVYEAAGLRGDRAATVGVVHGDLADELPDEDLPEDLADCLDMYEPGSKPRCEEVEYLATIQEAMERIARGH
ncbi:hypothetical protein [Streptomyces sp. TP-A0874]|uniref:hypothetical protein n=1 Tax=Streptomyces sp. TP-A0874 TaxID=549819 RepID=UPI000B1C2127|nr:hypothetical protein [Streptomyces sp. TP-A0874]